MPSEFKEHLVSLNRRPRIFAIRLFQYQPRRLMTPQFTRNPFTLPLLSLTIPGLYPD